MSLSSKINQYLQSSAGKRKLQGTLDGYMRQGVSRTNGGAKLVTKEVVQMLAAQLRGLIVKHAELANVPTSVMNNIRSLVCTAPYKDNTGGSLVVDLYFASDLHRESLYEDGYPDGISNIIALFNNGYLASDFVYGWWDGHKATGAEASYRSFQVFDSAFARSKIARPGLQFLQDAVSEFNTTVGSDYMVTVKLDDIYNETPTVGR